MVPVGDPTGTRGAVRFTVREAETHGCDLFGRASLAGEPVTTRIDERLLRRADRSPAAAAERRTPTPGLQRANRKKDHTPDDTPSVAGTGGRVSPRLGGRALKA